MAVFEDVRKAVEVYVDENFTATSKAWDNVNFDPKGLTTWIRTVVRESDKDPETISSGSREGDKLIGIVMIQIFQKENSGTATARGHADTLSGLLRRVTLNLDGGEKLYLETPVLLPIGNDGNGWYQLNLTTEFHVHT